ncbi:MAG: glycosyl hydrolase, partial [Acidobacteria bacterium]|nr:glycosyl hydrolase [Acidobacteriota bacterium]
MTDSCRRFLLSAPLVVLAAIPPLALEAQIDSDLIGALEWRSIGPFRGGRVTAVAGVIQDTSTFYMGATGGGVWKTEDGGVSWNNVSDGHFGTGSVGAIAVAPSDPNVVFVGMGEAAIRGVANSHGDGVYKSTDGGASWTHLGLEETRHISAVQVDPRDPDVVFVAAQGYQGKATPERGIYRSTDGGTTWELVLFVSADAGASSLSMDVTNSRILYAGFWQHRRYPWKVESGGLDGGIYKTTDGGDTWEELTEGLPELPGKIGVAVSPATPERVWAIIEAEEGGLFRSDDAGASWERINEERVLRARAWYYTHIFADPQDAERVWVLNAPAMRSIDGGKTFTRVSTPHGDNHALWIHPHDNTILINGNDGGANISYNGGKTWSTQDNQPTAQIYRVNTDNQFPYRIYGGQQDNSSVSIASRTINADGIGRDAWTSAGGCETAYSAFDPDNPRYIYSGCYQGLIGELDTVTRHERSVMAYEFLGLGATPSELRYRFNWNAPIVASPHDPTVIYHAANKLLKTTDRGTTWREISPDLTRDEESKQGPGGGPITNEAAGGENYNTILYVAESPHEAGTIWVGSDDGLVHLTRDGGANWSNVTPSGLEESMINTIEVSPHDPAKAYLAVTRYKFGDYAPRIYRTTDYGQSWHLRVDGIDDEAW